MSLQEQAKEKHLSIMDQIPDVNKMGAKKLKNIIILQLELDNLRLRIINELLANSAPKFN